jgi:hypothetical protein
VVGTIVNDNEGSAARPHKARRSGIGDAREKFLLDPKDNAAACRERAAADLAEAASLATPNARRLLETSAARWGVRAELLQRLEGRFEARKAARAPLDQDVSE